MQVSKIKKKCKREKWYITDWEIFFNDNSGLAKKEKLSQGNKQRLFRLPHPFPSEGIISLKGVIDLRCVIAKRYK